MNNCVTYQLPLTLRKHIVSSSVLGIDFYPPKVQGVQKQSLVLRLGSGNGLISTAAPRVSGRRKVMIRASSEIDGGAPSSSDEAKEEGENSISVENLPLETKLQLKLEQKLRMKLARKIRLRRKRLVRKRRMRKKGRWPPSKMKKNKNV